MDIAPINSTNQTASSAFGLDFESLLRIILTQLTYQDPLKPIDNFQFVSQLAQFAQLQQTQSLNDQVTSLLTTQASTQATNLLGRNVDLSTPGGTLSGEVTAVSFTTGQPLITITTLDGNIVGNLSIADVTQVYEFQGGDQ